MKEINEKDLEQAVGGVGRFDPKCENYSAARPVYVRLPENNKTCLTCVHYHKRDMQEICDLQDGQGGES